MFWSRLQQIRALELQEVDESECYYYFNRSILVSKTELGQLDDEWFNTLMDQLKTEKLNQLTMEQMTVAEAIEKGYEYCYVDGDESVTELKHVDPDDIRSHGAVICQSEPVFHTIRPERIRELIEDCIRNDQSFYDPEDEMASAVDKMDDSVFGPLADAVNEAISCVCFYPSVGIKLIP